MNGQEITFDVGGQPAAGYLALPTKTNAPGVLVLHAWWGLNSIFKNLCDHLASEGFVAFAPDLNSGRVVTTIDEAKQTMSELPFERKQDVVDAAVDYLRARPEVSTEPLSLLGFSMGASWSLNLASQRPEDFGKIILFYGADAVDFSKIHASILGHYAGTDELEPLDGVRAMEADMRTAGLSPTFHIYPDMQHWFFEEDRPEYNAQAAELAWTRTLEFLRS